MRRKSDFARKFVGRGRQQKSKAGVLFWRGLVTSGRRFDRNVERRQERAGQVVSLRLLGDWKVTGIHCATKCTHIVSGRRDEVINVSRDHGQTSVVGEAEEKEDIRLNRCRFLE